VRLLPVLSSYTVIGVDMVPPADPNGLAHFEKLDLGTEASCPQLVRLLREFDVRAVVHMAFVIDPLRTGVTDTKRMWQINVAGTARVMEAIAEVNRQGGRIDRFIFPGSVSAYGPETPPLVLESQPLAAKSLPYALHKQECDEVVQFRASKLGDCATFLLRPHIFVGASVENYLVGALRGTPTGKGNLARRAREKNRRLPLLMPRGQKYLDKKIQFLHVDDIARLIVYLLGKKDVEAGATVFNVAADGDALTMQQCANIAGAKLLRLPTRWLCRRILTLMWDIGLSGVPPSAFPYVVGSYTMDTTRLKNYLGADYKRVIRYTVEEALADTFRAPASTTAVTADAASTS
jgi:nucleoside-diphosphate-sugar epimerase